MGVLENIWLALVRVAQSIERPPVCRKAAGCIPIRALAGGRLGNQWGMQEPAMGVVLWHTDGSSGEPDLRPPVRLGSAWGTPGKDCSSAGRRQPSAMKEGLPAMYLFAREEKL